MEYIAYHGTHTDIEQFEEKYQGKGRDQYGSGFYFTTDKESAKGYALEPKRNVITGEMEESNTTLITAKVIINNPIHIDGKEYANLSGIIPTLQQTKNIIRKLPSLYLEEDNILGDYFDEYWDKNSNKEKLIDKLITKYYYPTDLKMLDILFVNYPKELHEAIRESMGYDGIIVDFKDSMHIIPWFKEQIEIIEKEYIDLENEIERE